MDNLNFHKMLVVRRAIEAAGAMPIYLPTYSPELNPIEMLGSDLKRDLRRMGLDTVEMVRWALRRLKSALPLRRIDGWSIALAARCGGTPLHHRKPSATSAPLSPRGRLAPQPLLQPARVLAALA